MKNKGNITKLALGALIVACCTAALLFFIPKSPNNAQDSSNTNNQTATIVSDQDTQQNTSSPNTQVNTGTSSSRKATDSVVSADGSVVISGEHQTNVVLVTLDEGADPAQTTAILKTQPCLDMSATTVTADDVASGFVMAPLAQGYNVADAIAMLNSAEGISGSQPNYIYHLLDTVEASDGELDAAAQEAAVDTVRDTFGLRAQDDVDDPYGKKNAASERSWHLSSINAYDAWSLVKGENLGDDRVTVAILDSGYDIDHEDLTAGASNGIGGNVIAAYDATAGIPDYEDDDYAYRYNTGIADEHLGHGTHVAGIVSGIANNGKGVAGVSYNANILPIQVFYYCEDKKGANQNYDPYNNASSVTLKKAYDYLLSDSDHNGKTVAQETNTRVVNMSLGGPQGTLSQDDTLFINAAEQAYEGGIVTVCAAGNENTSENYFPVDCLKHGLGVIAVNKQNQRASFSNYNSSSAWKAKDISAPGETIYSTLRTGGYGAKSGTSMATPVVSGVVALVLTANPELSAGDAINIIHDTATDIVYTNGDEVAGAGFDQYTGYGLINAQAAVERAGGFLSGDATMLKGTAIDLSSTVSPPTGSWTWASSDTSVATVENGTVTGVDGGTAKITATSGDLTLEKDITVFDIWFSVADDPDNKIDEIEIEQYEKIEINFNENPDTGMWLIGSSNRSVAEVSVPSSGPIVVEGKARGKAEITATLKENPSLTVSFDVNVREATDKRSIESTRAKVYWSWGSYFMGRPGGSPSNAQFTGYAIEPSPYVMTYTTGNGRNRVTNSLAYGTDYKVEYSENINVGTATVSITGIGSYTGTISSTFNITQASLQNIQYTIGNVEYTGSPIEYVPEFTLSTSGYKLVEGKDFTVTGYKNNTEISANTADGHASVLLALSNNYASSTAGAYFNITPISLDNATVTASGWTYNGAVHDPGVKVKLNGSDLPQNGNWTYEITKDGTVVQPDAIRDAGTYTVTVTGTGNYGGTATTTFTVGQKSITGATAKLAQSSYTYDGKAKTPGVTVTLSDGTVLGSSNYSVSYQNNTNAGRATVTVTGKGNYKGSVSNTFTISPAQITGVRLSSTNVTYNGSAQTPTATATWAGGDVPAGSCSVTYSNNVNAGRANVRITASGNFTGNASATFTISPAPITGVRLSQSSYIYDGSARTPAATATWAGGNVPSSGYSVSYANNVDPGRATATVTGKGNYTGSASASFTITKPDEPKPVTSEEESMYRLYNPNSGEHFYTSSSAERDTLVMAGWNSEGEGWTAPEHSNTPVYRMYNPVAGEHHYTPDASERDMLVSVGWNDEGIGWYSDDSKRVPLYRDYNPNAYSNNHNYTADWSEHIALMQAGWRDEGTAWYGM